MVLTPTPHSVDCTDLTAWRNLFHLLWRTRHHRGTTPTDRGTTRAQYLLEVGEIAGILDILLLTLLLLPLTTTTRGAIPTMVLGLMVKPKCLLTPPVPLCPFNLTPITLFTKKTKKCWKLQKGSQLGQVVGTFLGTNVQGTVP